MIFYKNQELSKNNNKQIKSKTEADQDLINMNKKINKNQKASKEKS
jgi:hypothetical protein